MRGFGRERPEREHPSHLPADVPALVRLDVEFASYYVGLAPGDFRMPDEDGLGAYIESELHGGGGDVLELVAELDGEVVGAMWARLARRSTRPVSRSTRRTSRHGFTSTSS